jgi:thiol-disulfide isomerase/thioredoxin
MKKNIFFVLIIMLISFAGCGGRPSAAQPADPERGSGLQSGTAGQDTESAKPGNRADHEKPVGLETDMETALKSIGMLTPTRQVLAPDFTLDDLNGKPVSLSSLQGKVVFLNFWGSWCKYCRDEMPSIQSMYNSLKSLDFEILAVNVNDSPQAAKKYIIQNNYSFPVVLDTEYRATQLYGVRGFPTTYIIDQKGYLIGKLVGSRSWDTQEVLTVFKKLIAYEY